MYQVEMVDLGRNKVTIKKDFDHINYNNLRLMSDPFLASGDIGFSLDEEETSGIRKGTVLAGFRTVGKIRITELSS